MITHDRWQQIKKIFHSAQDLTPAERANFLAEVCGDDVSMREEVEALLTADADNEDFLSSPAYEFAAELIAGERHEFTAGQKVGRFEILCSLGAGGMGQIYLAHDAQLNRKIALKLIAREFATDPARVLRFKQEALAASALNHPNVCVIHDIGTADNGRHFIAMEYIQGLTLRDQLARGTFRPLEALQVAIQVGAALASAHAVGIVHRDVKPENIMVRPDGYVKVVDFGLAKLTEALPLRRRIGEDETRVRTEPRTLMGTMKYMSPEQLREGPVDERTDIWSLGIVLYEMLTGVTPFEAVSRNDSVALILGSQSPELLLSESVPSRLREIVKKTLEKDCDARYQTITKLTADLTSLKRELERNAESFVDQVPGPLAYGINQTNVSSAFFTRFKSQAMLTADFLVGEIKLHKRAAIFAGVTSVLALLFILPGVVKKIDALLNPPAVVQSTNTPAPSMKQLTHAGKSVCSAISYDGKLVAHAEEQDGKQQLVVTNTTNFGSSIAVPAEEVQYLGVTFSRDGNYLYFTRKEKNNPGTLYRLAWPGTNPTKLKTGVDSPISFSPQGDRFAFVRVDEANSEYSLMVANVDGTNEQLIASRTNGERLSVFGVAWSPDGNTVVCPSGQWSTGYHMKLVGFDLTNKREHVIGNQSWFSILQVAWSEDATGLVISARERETSPHHLWRINLPDGTAQKITFDPADYRGVSLHGDSIVTVRISVAWKIWVSDIDDAQNATPIASGNGLVYGLSWTSAGKIVLSSMANDRLNISRINTDGSNPVQLTTDAGDNYMPAASADGRYIVFSSNRSGPFNIWRMNAEDGSEPTQLTFTDANFYPACSPDNQWVAYDHAVNTKVSLWKVPLQGGEPIKVGEKYRMPAFSPDSQFIAGRYTRESGTRDVAIFSAQGGPPLRHFAVPVQEWQSVQWLRSGRQLSFVKNEKGYSNIWSYDLDKGASKQLTNFNSDQIYAYAWSPDYKKVATQRGTRISDVTMISER